MANLYQVVHLEILLMKMIMFHHIYVLLDSELNSKSGNIIKTF